MYAKDVLKVIKKIKLEGNVQVEILGNVKNFSQNNKHVKSRAFILCFKPTVLVEVRQSCYPELSQGEWASVCDQKCSLTPTLGQVSCKKIFYSITMYKIYFIYALIKCLELVVWLKS
jgi:hypothetical protein